MYNNNFKARYSGLDSLCAALRHLLPVMMLFSIFSQQAFAVGPTFVCDGRPYPTFGSNPTTLQEMDKQTLAVTNIAAVSPSGTINATGYNILDNYIYGLQGKDFFQLAADGTYTMLGQPTGIGTATGIAWNIGVTYSGTMDASGYWYGHDNNYVYRVTIGTNPSAGSLTYERFSRSGSFTGRLADLAFNPLDGNLYGMSGGALRRITITGVGSTVTTVGDALSGNAGGAWSTSSGVLYFYNNGNGLLYSVDMVQPTPTASFVGNVPSNGTFDATACTPPVLAKSVNTNTVAAGEEFTYTFKISNPFTNPLTVDFTDNLPAGLSFVSGSLSPAAPGGGTVTTFDSNTLNIDNVTLPAGMPPANELVFTARATADGNILTTTTIPNTAQITYGVNSVTSDNPDTGLIDDPTSVTIHPNDWGDAPASMTGIDADLINPYGDAWHQIDSSVYLGTTIDAETASQSAGLLADGDDTNTSDDDDGVTFPLVGANPILRVGEANTVTVNASVNGFLNAWIDWNQDGDWDDPGEAIATNQAMVAGSNTLTLTPSATVPHGATYARFRFTSTTAAAPSPLGFLSDGEVEDYRINLLLPKPIDACSSVIQNTGFESLPNPSTYFIIPEEQVEGWATIADSPSSGANYSQRNGIEIWQSGFGSVPAFEGSYFAELNAWVPGMLYQDVELIPGSSYTWSFAHRGRSGTDTINVMMGPPDAPVLQGTYSTDNTAWKVYSGIYTVPAGQYITRFGFQAVGSASTGNFIDALTIPGGCDFGDAPAGYNTLLANNAAHHVSNNLLYLGANPGDSEIDGQPSVSATGDDGVALADEDGIITLAPITDQDQTYSVDVITNNQTGLPARMVAWIDFDGNGSFDPDEAALRTVPAGTLAATTTLTWSIIPNDIQAGSSYLRVRITTESLNNREPGGIKENGEVEDYAITIVSAGSTVSGRVFIDTNSNASSDISESGISGTVVVLLETASGICRSVSTDGSGNYAFMGVNTGSYQIYQSHGDSTPTPQNCAVTAQKNPVGFQSITPDIISATVTTTDLTNQDFGEVKSLTFEPNNQGQVLPGNTTIYTHTLNASTDGSVSFATVPSGNFSTGWGHILYHDADCDGFLSTVETNSPIASTSFPATAANPLCIINKVSAPANVIPTDQYIVEITATFTYAGGIAAPLTMSVTDQTVAVDDNMGGSRLELTKSVENLTQGTPETATLNQASPGDTLKYRLYFTNTGADPLTELTLNDTVPEYTTLVAGSVLCDVVPTTMSCSPSINSDALDWGFTGGLTGGTAGYVSFLVTVDN